MARALALNQDRPAAIQTEIDELTLLRAQRGDRPAFHAIVLRYQRPVFSLLSRMLAPSGRQAQVDDLAQETFIRLLCALPEFGRDGRTRLGSFVLTIAARLAIDELRRRSLSGFGTGEPLDDRLIEGPWRADDSLRRTTLREAIGHAVARLPPEQRAVFLLRELHELPYEEIAEALHLDLGTVKSRLSRARAALRAALEEVHE